MSNRQNPTDHARTTQPRAGEWFKNSRDALGLGLMALAVVATVACLFSAANDNVGWAIGMAVSAVVAGPLGVGWLFFEGRRLERIEANR